MDLTKLYNLTTPELRAEAERLGVSDTYALSRAQLIHAVRNRVGGPPPEGFLGRALGFAKWALRTTAAPAQEPSDAEAEDESAGNEVVERSDNEPREAKHLARPSDAPSGAPPSTTSSVSPVSSPPPKMPSSTPLSRAPTGVFSGAGSTFEEPFPTRTMARILASQGHYKRSLAIYANLLRDEPDNPELRGEADAVRSQSRARRPHM